jgi:lysozyme family protein
MQVYTEQFLTCFNFTMGVEGGASTDPNDPGGTTGVGGVTLPEWNRWLLESQQAPRPLESATLDDRKALAYAFYYEPEKLDTVPFPWAIFLFDAAYNLRFGSGAKIAQACLCEHGYYTGDIDGVLGEQSRGALADHPEVAQEAATARIGYHVCATLSSELDGLINRCKALKAKIVSVGL